MTTEQEAAETADDLPGGSEPTPAADAQPDQSAESDGLTEQEIKILEVEKGWWRLAKTRDQAIREHVGISPMRYYLLLSQMLDTPRVWKAEPALIGRLRELRDRRLDERR